MVETIISVQDIHFSYGDGNKALDGMTLDIPKGRKLAILGPNGAGKSTLFLHFNGLLKPDFGSLYYLGQPYRYNRKSLLTLRQRVGIVFQDPDTQLFSASVEQEVAFGPLNLGLPAGEVKRRLATVIKATGLEELRHRPTHLLSYGQKKRVTIAAVLAMEPDVLVFDEPTAWLDPEGSKQIMLLLDQLNSRGTTILLSTHDVDMAYSWADEVLVMSQGRKLAAGGCPEVLGDRRLLDSAHLAVPWMLDVFGQMQQAGLVPAGIQPPRHKEQLLKLIQVSGVKGSRKEVMA